ncbi:MAG: hypothetical protein ACREUD_05160 [Gammaproteobacteria bacterium]
MVIKCASSLTTIVGRPSRLWRSTRSWMWFMMLVQAVLVALAGGEPELEDGDVGRGPRPAFAVEEMPPGGAHIVPELRDPLMDGEWC